MKAIAIELVQMIVAIFFACLGAEASEEKGAEKTKEAITVINRELDDADGLVRPWWMPKSESTNGLLRLGINALCAWEKKKGFFAGWNRWLGSLEQLFSSLVSSVS